MDSMCSLIAETQALYPEMPGLAFYGEADRGPQPQLRSGPHSWKWSSCFRTHLAPIDYFAQCSLWHREVIARLNLMG